MLDRLLSVLVSSGIDKFTVALGWKGDTVRAHLNVDSAPYEIRLVDVKDYAVGPLMTLTSSLESLSDDLVMVVPSDTVLSPTIAEAAKDATSWIKDAILLMVLDSRQTGSTPVYVKKDGTVSGVLQPISEYDYKLQSAMVVVLKRSLLPLCRAVLSSGGTKLVDVINRSIADGLVVRYVETSAEWFDIDNVDSLLDAQRYLLDSSQSVVSEGILVPKGDVMAVGDNLKLPSGTIFGSDVELVGPVIIDEGCIIESGSSIGPYTYLGSQAHVFSDCNIEDSLVYASKIARSTKMSGTVVYDGAVLRRTG